MIATNRPPVFKPNAWANPAPGVWEAVATPEAPAGQPPFEAVAIVDSGAERGWRWALYQPLTDEPIGSAGCLGRIADGHAPTLASACRQAESAARQWRDLQHNPLEVR